MGNFVAIHLLKGYNPGTFNRGENGEAKQIIIGGVNRARFSSQCQKRAIREMMACEEIKSSHIENLIANCLDLMVKNGTITEEEKDVIGYSICNKAIIGIDDNLWESLMGRYDKKVNRVVVNTNASEIDALVNTFVKYVRENGTKALVDDKKTHKLATQIASNSTLNDIKMSVTKALFGNMATDGIFGTVDGALQMGQAYSVDAFMPEADIFTVKFTGRSGADKSDPFFGAYETFNTDENKRAGAETFNQGLSLNSNLMYSYANINIKEFKKNLDTFIVSRDYAPSEDTNNILIATVTDFIKAMIKMTPEATQNRSASYVEPTMVLIEIIKDDTNIQPDWTKVITNNGKEIAEQAIERMSNFANNKTFRAGTVKQYVMFGSEYGQFADKFIDATQINNFNELTDIIKNEVTPLI